MVAATENKKKRGRPPADFLGVYDICPEKSKRAAQNYHYAFVGWHAMDEDVKPFFLMADGSLKRQGVAERIGRMLKAGQMSEEDAASWGRACMELYREGHSSKEIERILARMAREAKTVKGKK